MRRVVGLALVLALAGCDDEPIQVGRGLNASGGRAPRAREAADGGVDGGGGGPAQYRDEDFAEAETNRDPFRNYAAMFQVRAPENVSGGREVVMPDTGLDEMRLIGIISGLANPHAMLIDRNGVGHTVRRGAYVGRSEVVQAGGSEDLPVTLNWRVDRIRPSEVVLTREDPTAPNRPPLTHVIPLRQDESVVQDEASSGTPSTPRPRRSSPRRR